MYAGVSSPAASVFGLRGLRVGAIVDIKPRQSVTVAENAAQIAHVVRVEQWTEFEENVTEQRESVRQHLERSGCRPATHSSHGRCDGTFRDRTCQSRVCREIAIYKEDIGYYLDTDYPTEWELCTSAAVVFNALLDLASEIDTKQSNTRVIKQKFFCHDEGRPNVADFMVRRDHRASGHNIVVVEVKLPSYEASVLEPPEAGNHVASKYRKHFEKRRNKFREGRNPPLDWHHHALAQCFGYACGTDSGYGALYTHNSMIAIQVVPTQFQNRMMDPSVTVKMSKVYKCDDENTSTLHAILALFRMAKQNGNGSTKDALSRLQHQIGCLNEKPSQRDLRVIYEQPAGQGNDVDGRTGSGSSASKSRRSTGSGSQAQSVFSNTVSCAGSKQRESFGYEFVEETPEETEMVRRAILEGTLLELCQPDLERLFVSHRTGYIGRGVSGFVFSACVAGVEMAVKRWNWEGPEGIKHLEHEMFVYKTVLKRNADLLGDVMPRMFAVVNKPREECALVLEFVGSELKWEYEDPDDVTRNESPRKIAWYVDGVKLDENDEDEISEAATESAKRLQECGIYHDDLRHPNLRVQRLGIEDNGERRWRVWWIDFGRTAVVDMEVIDSIESAEQDRVSARRGAEWRWELGSGTNFD